MNQTPDKFEIKYFNNNNKKNQIKYGLVTLHISKQEIALSIFAL